RGAARPRCGGVPDAQDAGRGLRAAGCGLCTRGRPLWAGRRPVGKAAPGGRADTGRQGRRKRAGQAGNQAGSGRQAGGRARGHAGLR
ncbi:hypothetical protein ACFU6S_44415, partial [Streptomyces sp. NPDC057456]